MDCISAGILCSMHISEDIINETILSHLECKPKCLMVFLLYMETIV